MSWTDLFYPDNPERREELIRKNQEVCDLMKDNFYATNQIIDVLNQHYQCSFSHIELNENGTVLNNCNVLIDCIRKIQDKVSEIDQRLKEMLEPELYEKLKNNAINDNDLETIAHILEGTVGTGGAAGAVALYVLINRGMVLEDLISNIGKIGAGIVGTVAIAVVCLGIEMIVEAILGKIERDELENGLKEYDVVLSDFEPKSREYDEVLIEVKVTLENHLK